MKELFFRNFASGNDRIHWISNTNEETPDHKQGNNHIHLIEKGRIGGIPGYYMDRIRALKKMSIGKKVLAKNEIDIIVANDGVIEGLIGLRLARRYGKKFAFYMSSLFFDMDRNEFRTMPSLRSFFSMMENLIKVPLLNYIISRSDVFHPISEAMGDRYSHKRIFPLPLCPADSFFDSYREPEPFSEPFRMIYIGQVTPVRRIDLLIEVLHDVKDSTDVPVELLIVGKLFRKGYRKKLLNMIQRYDLERNVQLIDEISFDEVPKMISSCHLGLCILPPITAYRVSSPTKVVEYLSLGIPVVANSEIEDQKLIISSSRGGLAPIYDREQIKEAILNMINNSHNLKDIGEAGRKWVKKNRNYQILSDQLKEQYRKLNQ